MSQNEVELILTRQLASYLAMPVFVVNPEGSLIYYNEAAEGLLGNRFDLTDEMPLEEWASAFNPTTEDGEPLAADDLPLAIALRDQRPAHLGPFRILGLDGVARSIAVTAFPLVGQQGRRLGAVAIFWEVDPPRS
jgi:PAS domain-containing protein